MLSSALMIMSTVSILCLPNELLMKIFSYIHVSDISLAVSKVCRRWNELSTDKFLWSQLELTVEEETSLCSVLSLLSKLPHLQFITLRWRNDTEEIVDALCIQCQYLEKIHFFSCCHVKSICVQKMSDNCKYLKDFSLGKCYSVQRSCFDDVSKMKNLTALNLSHSKLNSEQFRIISTCCMKINCLNIDFVRGISEDDLILFIAPRIVQLQSLTVFGELLTDNIFQHIEVCPKLRHLHISTCSRFSKRCFGNILKLNSLKSLTMRKLVSISSISLHIFYYNSGLKKKLSYLYISAKRTFTEEEFNVWYRDDKSMEDSKSSFENSLLKSRYCILILRKNGFSFQILDGEYNLLLRDQNIYY